MNLLILEKLNEIKMHQQNFKGQLKTSHSRFLHQIKNKVETYLTIN